MIFVSFGILFGIAYYYHKQFGHFSYRRAIYFYKYRFYKRMATKCIKKASRAYKSYRSLK